MVRRTLLEERRFEPGLETAEDRDLWIRLAAAAPVYLVNQSLATYVQEPGSLSRSNVDLDCGNMLRVVRRHVTVLGRRELKAQEAIVYRRWASGHLARGQGYSAIMPAINRLRLQPLSLQAWWIAAKALAMAATGVESRRRERRLPP